LYIGLEAVDLFQITMTIVLSPIVVMVEPFIA
jgi:hypothetical protein